MPSHNKIAIRFGLAAIKAIGQKASQKIKEEREKNGNFIDIYDFASRLDSKIFNKKSFEAFVKSGSFDNFIGKGKEYENRKILHDSFYNINNINNKQKKDLLSGQLQLFSHNELKNKLNIDNKKEWNNEEILKKEFEAFGFFPYQNPLLNISKELTERGVVFTDFVLNELNSNSIIYVAVAVIAVKHKSGKSGRYAYIIGSDLFNVIEISVFDSDLIADNHDILEAGNILVIKAIFKKDDISIRLIAKEIYSTKLFIKQHKIINKAYIENIRERKSLNNLDNYQYKKEDDPIYINSQEKDKINLLLKKKAVKLVNFILFSKEHIFKLKFILDEFKLNNILKSNLDDYQIANTDILISYIENNSYYQFTIDDKYLLELDDVSNIKKKLDIFIEIK